MPTHCNQETAMTLYAAPGTAGAKVAYKTRYDNFINGQWGTIDRQSSPGISQPPSGAPTPPCRPFRVRSRVKPE